MENTTWLQPQEPGLAHSILCWLLPAWKAATDISWSPGKVTPEGCIGFLYVQGQHPKQLCSCLTGQISHLERKKKSLQPRGRHLWIHMSSAPSHPSPGTDRIWQEREMPAPSMPLAAFSPFNTSDHSIQEAPQFLQTWGGFFQFYFQRSRISAAMQCVLLQCRPSKPRHRERVPAPLTSPQRIQPCLALGKGSVWTEATGLAQSSREVFIHHGTNVSLEISEQDTARVQVLHLGRLVFLILLLLAGKGHFQRLLHLVVHS